MRIPVRRLLLSLALPATIALPAPARACDAATARAVPTDRAQLVAAEAVTVCLVNERRAAAGLRALAVQARLTVAARGHADAMVDGGFFAHESPGGRDLLDRLRAAAWVPSSGGFAAGENIAWGSGSLGSPAEIVAAWMASPGHRANILRGDFREIGLGIAAGSPRGGRGPAATYVADFGRRQAAARKAARART